MSARFMGCLNKLRQLASDDYHNYDVIDDVGRLALVQRTYSTHLGLAALQTQLRQSSPNPVGQFATIDKFLRTYDILNEYREMRVRLPDDPIPTDVTADREWCKSATLSTNIGVSEIASAVSTSAARYYALLRSRRFLDFSTAENELLRLLESDAQALATLRSTSRVVVVDEVQDLNPVQRQILELMVGDDGQLVAVGDHRQAIFGFRGGLVRIMGEMYDEVAAAPDSAVVDLSLNYRSTPRIIALANAWAARIAPPGGLPNIDMRHGNENRADYDASHVGITRFATLQDEANWVAGQIAKLVADGRGARHDARRDGNHNDRGLGYQDIAVLLRASGNARVFMRALEQKGIPAVFRAGPDLFAQPEVLLFLAALSAAAGVNDFQGGKMLAPR
jgi:DNA helicase-2/ATP-dependent DNA helicase PcrA